MAPPKNPLEMITIRVEKRVFRKILKMKHIIEEREAKVVSLAQAFSEICDRAMMDGKGDSGEDGGLRTGDDGMDEKQIGASKRIKEGKVVGTRDKLGAQGDADEVESESEEVESEEVEDLIEDDDDLEEEDDEDD